MAKDNRIQMPGVFGGLMRYDSEYKSRFMFSPVAVVVFIVAIILFVIIIKILFPVPVQPVDVGGVPVNPHGGFIIPLLRGFVKI